MISLVATPAMRHISIYANASPWLQEIQALWELPWKTSVLWPRFIPSQSRAPEATHGRLDRKTGGTHLCCSDAVEPDSLPRQVLGSGRISNGMVYYR